MGERLDLYRERRDRARAEATAANIRQDNITRRGNQVLGPQNPFNQPSRDNYQSYPYDYYSGADAKIFFGDIWVDDIVTIQFNVSQSKTPIYGYASQLYDAVAKGQVIVQGNLTISFKETGYLNIIQYLLEQQRRNSGSNIKRVLQKRQLEAKYGAAEFIPGLTTTADTSNSENGVVFSANGTPSLIRQNQTIEDVLKGKLSESFSAGLGLSKKQRDFEDFAEILEDTIWGDANGRPFESKLNKKLRRPDEFDYNSIGGINVGRAPYNGVLNILLTFGDINDFRAEHTLVSINDVHFQSQGMVVAPDGTPIAEQYNFFARDINNELGGSKTYKINPIKLETGIDDLTISTLNQIDALNDQLVKERIPQYVTITSRAALPRDGVWKPLTPGKDGYFVIYMDQRTQTGGLEQQYKDSQDEITRLGSRDKPFKTRIATNIAGRRQSDAVTERNAAAAAIQADRQMAFNGYEPLIDQIIKYVEREFNEFDGSLIDVRNAQYIVDVNFSSSPQSSFGNQGEDNPTGVSTETITMVLDQSIPNSRTYKVIAPTRTDFGAANVFTREDLFGEIKPFEEFQEDLGAMEERLQEQHQRLQEQRGEYQDELERIAGERAGTLQRRQDREAAQIAKYEEILAGEQGPLTPDERRKYEEALAGRRTEYQRLDVQIEELTNDTYSDADVALLRRRNQGEFEAARDEYDRLAPEAEYYENEANRVSETADEVNNLVEDEAQRQLDDYVQNSLPAAQQNAQQQYNARLEEASTTRQQQDAEAERRQEESDRLILAQYNQQVATELGLGLADDDVYIAESVDELKAAAPVINNIYSQFGYNPIITSGNDSLAHGVNSLHYQNSAWDIRTGDITGWVANTPEGTTRDIADAVQAQLGEKYTVILESDHIHLEYDPIRPNTTGRSLTLGIDVNEPEPYDPPTPAQAPPAPRGAGTNLEQWNEIINK